jgi:hypothetical protein
MQIINAPMFLISNIEVNEYTLRQYMIDVMKGLEEPCEVTDLQTGQITKITKDGFDDEDGKYDIMLDSLHLSTDLKFEALRIKNHIEK